VRTFLALTLLGLAISQTQTVPKDKSGLEVVEFRFKEKFIETEFPRRMVSNRPPVLNPNPNDPPSGTSQMSDAVRDTFRKSLPSPSNRVKIYSFQALMKNDSSRPIISFVWAYRLPQASSTNQHDASDQEYLCNVRIEPGETKVIKVRSPIPRHKVVDATAAGTPPASHQPSINDMIINRVRFADDSTWQRPAWNPVIVSRLGARKLDKGKCVAL
jgi:hypothetical protein